jgi:hypothetical protein
MQMIDVELPTTDDRVVVLSRYTEPEKDLLLLRQLKIQLPAQPPPKIKARNNREVASGAYVRGFIVGDPRLASSRGRVMGCDPK